MSNTFCNIHSVGTIDASTSLMNLDVVSEYNVQAYTIPTETPLESDGTLDWSSTTIVLLELKGGNFWGIGYTYGPRWLVPIIRDLTEKCVLGKSWLDIEERWLAIKAETRNYGKIGAASLAVSAIDIALWDLKAKALNLPLSGLLGAVHAKTEVYGSGGFTNFTHAQLATQMEAWAEQGIRKFKMKIGRSEKKDIERVHFVRDVVGHEAGLYVDANEAYDCATALKMAQEFARENVTWFEQPVSCYDRKGMTELRKCLPPAMRLADGEYIFDPTQARDLLSERCCDVVQLDATRAQGITGFLKSLALCEAFDVPVSTHCAPTLHLALSRHARQFTEIEYFSDHSRIEKIFFDGVPSVREGFLLADDSRLGLGLEIKRSDIAQYAV